MVEQAALRDGMFTDSLLETSWGQRCRRSWTTFTSFGVQIVAIGILLLMPLLNSVVAPQSRVVSTPISMGRRLPAGTVRISGHPGIQIVTQMPRLIFPGRMNQGVDQSVAIDAPPGDIVGDVLPIGDSLTGLPISTVMSGNHPVMPIAPAKPAPVKVFRPSSLLQGSLIRQVQPVYPPLARAARIEGPVVLAAVIAKDGTIDNLQLVSGHPMLVQSALQAVKQWRYKPYVLNGETIEVETRITVNFVLSHD